jgi:asparagine synthase (glutamine-hydrolysing)
MCGISGILSKKLCKENVKSRIINVVESLNHRGPDFSNIKELDLGYFGHNRLKIVDLSKKSNQPMVSNSNRYTIVFNGEIYNFKEIKDELIDKYQFNSDGDTEVILASIEIYGIDWFLDKSNGMFAISIYDSLENKIFLIRDRMGIKPLYYYLNSENLIFASEVKGILKSGLVEAKLNNSALDMYLAHRDTLEPETFFENIYQVKSGHYLEIDLNNMTLEENKFWDLPELEGESSKSEYDLIEELNVELLKSIKYRMISDVPFGTYLSGGVDSSLITSIVSNISKNTINTYTIGFKDKNYNEFEFSDIVANYANTNHHKFIQNKDEYLSLLDSLITYKDSPLGVPNEVSLAVMSKELKNDVSVVLSGEGADELFGGYGKIFRFPIYYDSFLKSKNNLSYFEEFINKYEYTNREIRNKYLNIDFKKRNKYDDLIKNDIFGGLSNFNSTQKFFHKIHIKSLLRRLDMTTMYASVEGRVPFLDHNLIEFVYKNISEDLKIKWCDNVDISKLDPVKYSENSDIPKYILKKVSEKYLPNEIIYRKKMGFPVPLSNWEDTLVDLAKVHLKNSKCLKISNVDDLLNDLKDYKIGFQILWMFINIELFYKNYFEKIWEY